MAKKSLEWSVKKQLDAARTGLFARYDASMLDYERKINEWVADPLRPAQNSDVGNYPAVVSVSLYRMGLLLSKRGSISVLEGRLQGWEDLSRACVIAYWVRRMEVKLAKFRFEKSRNRRHLLDRLHTVCVFGITHSIGIDEPASWLADALLADPGNEATFSNVGDFSPLNHLVYNIAAQWRNRSVDCSKIKVTKSCPAYQDVWTFWNDQEQLGRSLDAAADYHVANNNTSRERDEMDFFATFGEDIPWEILSVLRLRREQGLSDPPLTHPFLQTPLMSPPRPLPAIKDELLERAIAAGRTVFPDL